MGSWDPADSFFLIYNLFLGESKGGEGDLQENTLNELVRSKIEELL